MCGDRAALLGKIYWGISAEPLNLSNGTIKIIDLDLRHLALCLAVPLIGSNLAAPAFQVCKNVFAHVPPLVIVRGRLLHH